AGSSTQKDTVRNSTSGKPRRSNHNLCSSRRTGRPIDDSSVKYHQRAQGLIPPYRPGDTDPFSQNLTSYEYKDRVRYLDEENPSPLTRKVPGSPSFPLTSNLTLANISATLTFVRVCSVSWDTETSETPSARAM